MMGSVDVYRILLSSTTYRRPRRGWRACVTDSVLCENVRACAGRVAADNLQACFHDTRALNRAEIV